MSNHYTSGHGNSGTPGSNSNAFVSRREVRANNMTGALPPLSTYSPERPHIGASDFDQMIQSLRDLFEHDRQVASQSDSTRCGICYLHHVVNELHYRDEGFYVCANCERTLGNHHLPMLRAQQKLG